MATRTLVDGDFDPDADDPDADDPDDAPDATVAPGATVTPGVVPRRRPWVPGWAAVRRGLGFGCAVVVFAAVLGVLLQLRYGYSAGTNDHLVLSLQGLQWGRPGFLVRDWFVASSPQPHVLFDLVTWWGAATGRIADLYLAWWVLGLVVGGLATAVLATVWTPVVRVPVAAAVALLLGLGPEVALGTTTPALPTALPQELGGMLAYLSLALLLTRRPRLAALVVVLTSVVHVQLGALVVVVSLLAFAGSWLVERVASWSLLAGAVAGGAVVVAVLRLRPVAGAGDDFVQICREVIPFHCDAPTWSVGQLGSGFAIVLAALLTLGYVVRGGSGDVVRWVAAVVAPAVGLTLGVVGNRYGWPVVGRLAQSTNVFRLAVLLVPLGAWGLVTGVVRMRARWRTAWVVAMVPAGYGWLVPPGGATALPGQLRWGAAVLACLALAAVIGMPRGWGWKPASAVPAAAAAAVLVVGAVGAGTLVERRFDPTFVPDPRFRELGRVVAEHVPEGEVVTAPPTLSAIRLTAGRSLLVDCKAVPYGGAAWHDYRARLDAIGGRDACRSGGRPWSLVPVTSLTDTMVRYDSRYLVLGRGDRRVPELERRGWQVLVPPGERWAYLWLLAAPGAPDAGRAGATLPS